MATRSKFVSILSNSLLVIAISCASIAQADCGSIPYYAPFKLSALAGAAGFLFKDRPDGQTEIEFNPLDVVVYEPGQRAIILWNGEEETLLLSTEIRTSQPTSILEVIPLPSEPEITLGNFETFEKMQTLLIQKQMWTVASGGGIQGVQLPPGAAEITFHEMMGAHEISVVRVIDRRQFTTWVHAFLQSQSAVNPQIDPAFLDIIQNYLRRGFRWFVFDSIDATNKLQTRQPIQYRFKTDKVFYPLEISTLEKGKTLIELLIVTKKPLQSFSDIRPAAKRSDPLTITGAELQLVSEEWAAFMGSDECTMHPLRIKGKLHAMTDDFEAW